MRTSSSSYFVKGIFIAPLQVCHIRVRFAGVPVVPTRCGMGMMWTCKQTAHAVRTRHRRGPWQAGPRP